jgi:hypothetical protein
MIIQETGYPFADTSIFCFSNYTKYFNTDVRFARVQLYSDFYREA